MTAAEFEAGMRDVRATMAEMWRRHTDGEMRGLSMRALKAAVQADLTVQAADAFMRAKTRAEKKAALRKLEIACIGRIRE